MAREDLVSALKNAVDRREPLDAAKISLITAGYSIDDVEEAAKEIWIHPELSQKAPSMPFSSFPGSPSKILSSAPSPGKEKPKTGRSMNWVIPVFIVVMLLLIGTVLYTYVLKKPAI